MIAIKLKKIRFKSDTYNADVMLMVNILRIVIKITNIDIFT